jgi:hypothetical protein
VVRDRNGKVVPGATVTIYLANTLTVATVYPTKYGLTPVAGGRVTSDSNGVWVAYVEDSDYPLTTLFDTMITKTGYATQAHRDSTVGGSAH